MRRANILLGCTTIALVTAAQSAWSQEKTFGYRDSNAVTIENLFAVGYTRITQRTESQGVTTDSHTGIFGVGVQGPFQAFYPDAMARIGYHRFVVPGLSVGIVATYLDTGVHFTTYVLAPRIGYAISVGEDTSLWLRGGVNYGHTTISQVGSKEKMWTLMAAGDILFVQGLAPHVAIMFGGIAEYGFAGKQSQEYTLPHPTPPPPSDDFRQLVLGGTLGMAIDF